MGIIFLSTAGYKYRYINEWNRIENPEVYPYTYNQLISDKSDKPIHWGKHSLLKNDSTTNTKRFNLDPQIIPYIKTDSKRITDLNVNAKSNKVFRRKYKRKSLRPDYGEKLLRYDIQNTQFKKRKKIVK